MTQPGYALTAFNQRFKSWLSYKFGKGFAAPPETISIFITYRCNLRCSMCSQWGETGSSKHYTREMLYEQQSLDTLKRLIDDVRQWKPTITLFGGEPLMYKGMFQLVEHIKSSGLRCNMITNGVMLKHFAKNIVDSGMDEIIWSLDGPEDIHDQIRGRNGTFSRAVEGIEEVVTLRDRANLKKPVININSTMFESNYLRMDETIKVAENVGAATLTFHHLIFVGKEQYARHDKMFNDYYGTSYHDWSGFIWDSLPSMDPLKIISEVRRLEKQSFATSVHFYPNLTDDEIKLYYSNFDFTPKSYKPRCMSPWMVAYVMPSGEVRPCYLFNYPIGNINDAPLTQIWNSAQYRRFRQITKREGIYPVCSRCTELYRF